MICLCLMQVNSLYLFQDIVFHNFPAKCLSSHSGMLRSTARSIAHAFQRGHAPTSTSRHPCLPPESGSSTGQGCLYNMSNICCAQSCSQVFVLVAQGQEISVARFSTFITGSALSVVFTRTIFIYSLKAFFPNKLSEASSMVEHLRME